LSTNDLSGWNFSQQNLSGANLSGSNLSGADFSGAFLVNANLNSTAGSANFARADLRGAVGFSGSATNAILPDGSINSPAIGAGQALRVRDFDGKPGAVLGTFVPVPITVNTSLSIAGGATLSVALHDGNWGSTINFAPGATVSLGGTLKLGIASNADLASLIGAPIRLFNWPTSPDPGNRFSLISTDPRFKWDTSRLYSNGDVQIVNLFGDANGDAKVDLSDLYALASNWKRGSHLGDPIPTWSAGDFTGNGVVDSADLAMLAQSWQLGCGASSSTPSLATLLTSLGLPTDSVPEPGGASIAACAAMIVFSRRRQPNVC
jgi:hypothetical protein